MTESREPFLVPLTFTATRVLATLDHAGWRSVVVGGAVRDALFGAYGAKDIDIELYGAPDVAAVTKVLSALGDVSQRGRTFGVLALSVDGEDFDVSFPRRDSVNGTGHRGFDITVDPHLDERTAFGRRDFTINAIGWEPLTGRLIDPFGGRADIEARVLRHTTEAFAEDPLRVLRAVQFAARFGLTLAPETAAECRRVCNLIARAGGIRNVVSRERIWGEWQKLVRRGTHLTAAFRALRESGLSGLFPELHALIGIEQDPDWHAEGDVWEHSVLSAQFAAVAAERDALGDDARELAVLGALCHDFGKVTNTQCCDDGRITSHGHARAGVAPARTFLESIGAPERVIVKLERLVETHMRHVGIDSPSPAQVRRLVRALNGDGLGPSIHDWARVVDADCGGRGPSSKPSPAAAWVRVAEDDGTAHAPAKNILTGEHLIAAGLRPGPAFRDILATALCAQDDGAFNDESGARAWLGAHLASD